MCYQTIGRMVESYRIGEKSTQYPDNDVMHETISHEIIRYWLKICGEPDTSYSDGIVRIFARGSIIHLFDQIVEVITIQIKESHIKKLSINQWV